MDFKENVWSKKEIKYCFKVKFLIFTIQNLFFAIVKNLQCAIFAPINKKRYDER